MNNMQDITRDFAESMQAAINAAETTTARAIDQVGAAMRAAEARRREGLHEVRAQRQQAAEMVAESLKAEQRIEREYQAAVDEIHAALIEVRPKRIGGPALTPLFDQRAAADERSAAE